jgi:hypothetical protein
LVVIIIIIIIVIIVLIDYQKYQIRAASVAPLQQ